MPVIIRLPENEAVEVNRLVTIPCVSDGVPKPNVVFFKDGNAVQTDGNRVTQVGQFLVITRAEISDAGMYSCTAQNSEGNVTSDPARLIVFRKYFNYIKAS